MSNWRCLRKILALLLSVVLALVFAGVDAAVAGHNREATLDPCRPARTDTVLSWDNGDCGSIYNEVSGQPGMKLAVRFQAPPWADYITAIQYFIRDDHVEDPANPNAPTTQPFVVRVWKPTPRCCRASTETPFRLRDHSIQRKPGWRSPLRAR